MHVHTLQLSDGYQVLLLLAVLLLIVGFRLRRMLRSKPAALTLERLWIVPAVYACVVAIAFVQHPPSPLGWLYAAGGLAAGGALGWVRGKTIRIGIDPVTHRLNQRASPLGILVLFTLFLARATVRVGGATHHDLTVLLSGALLAFALGVFSMMRLEMYLRGKHLLAETIGRPRPMMT